MHIPAPGCFRSDSCHFRTAHAIQIDQRHIQLLRRPFHRFHIIAMLPRSERFFVGKTSSFQRRNQHRYRFLVPRHIDEFLQIDHIIGKRLRISVGIFLFLIVVSELDKKKIAFRDFVIDRRQPGFIYETFRASAVFRMVFNLYFRFQKQMKYLTDTCLRISRYIIVLYRRVTGPENCRHSQPPNISPSAHLDMSQTFS